jgi:hypothetical protein
MIAIMQNTIQRDILVTFLEEWLDSQKPLIPLLRLVLLQSFVDVKTATLFSDRFIVQLVQVS